MSVKCIVNDLVNRLILDNTKYIVILNQSLNYNLYNVIVISLAARNLLIVSEPSRKGTVRYGAQLLRSLPVWMISVGAPVLLTLSPISKRQL